MVGDAVGPDFFSWRRDEMLKALLELDGRLREVEVAAEKWATQEWARFHVTPRRCATEYPGPLLSPSWPPKPGDVLRVVTIGPHEDLTLGDGALVLIDDVLPGELKEGTVRWLPRRAFLEGREP